MAEFEPKEYQLAVDLPNKRNLSVDIPADGSRVTVTYYDGIGYFLSLYAEDLEALRAAIVKAQDFVDGIKAEA